jgi:DNA-binding NarL/FixJ family response regulator
MRQATKTVRILVADDHEIVREGVLRLIDRHADLEVCGTAVTGREAVSEARRLEPDVVLLDISMPELNGLDAARKIRRLQSRPEVLIFTAHETDELIKKSFNAGAKSYILKSEGPEQLIEAIRSLGRHKPFFTERVSKIVFARFIDRAEVHPAKNKLFAINGRLSEREREVVQLVAEGKSNKEVASSLGISLRTAEAHRAIAMRKLGLDSVASLVRYAIRNRIIEA